LADTAPGPGEPLTITADDLPTWQTDGVVWSIAMVGDTVYVGGNFDHIRPPSTAPGDPQQQPRKNLAAFNATTGQPLSWNPVVEGTVFTAPTPQTDCDNLGDDQWVCDAVWEIKPSPDGSKLYVGGDFAKVNGEWRSKIASFDIPSGSLTTFKRAINSRVKALTVTADTVYAGGYFTAVDGIARQRLAAFSTADGSMTAWAPTADRSVHAMITTPDQTRVVLGGDFNRINGNPPHGMGAVDAGTGASAPWATGVDYISDTRRSWVTDLVKDGSTIYAGANGEGTFDGRLALDPADGSQRWIDQCLGATQAITLLDGILYSGSHAHDCSSQPDGFPDIAGQYPYQRLLAEPANPSGDTPPILHWFPNTNGGATSYNQGPRAMDNNGTHLWVGGDFTKVNGKDQQGLTRFGSLTAGPDVNPPQLIAKPQVSKPDGTTGTLKVEWKQTWDHDNKHLKYEVIRDGTTVVHTAEADSRFWDAQTMTFTDTGLAPGSTHTYSVRAIDPFNNRIRSSESSPVQAG
jgi:hypothetical protein